jgi:hypothetical protein
MNLMIKFKKSVDLLISDNSQVNSNKGHDFEHYVAHLFNAKNDYFAIQEWTTDHSDKRAGIKVESDSKPDFIVRYKPDNECFAVEAKWRAYPLYDPKIRDYVIQWAEPYQIKNYQMFSRKMNIPVFIAIGLAGTPKNPGFMFCIPLEEAGYPKLFRCILKKYQREPPNEPFFWDTKHKKLR